MVVSRDGTARPELVLRARGDEKPKDAETQRREALLATKVRLRGLTSSKLGSSVSVAVLLGVVGGISGIPIAAALGSSIPVLYGMLATFVAIVSLAILRIRHRRIRAGDAYRDEVRSVEGRMAELSSQLPGGPEAQARFEASRKS